MMTHQREPHYKSIPERYGRLVSYSLPCPGISLSHFLHVANGHERFYWESNNDHVAFAGVGTAIELFAYADRFETIQRRATELFADAVVLDEREPLAAPRLFGGFSFRTDFIPDNAWADFTPAHFVLPHYQLLQLGDETWLTINAHIPADENPRELLDDLKSALTAKIDELRHTPPLQPALPDRYQLTYPVDYNHWNIGLTQVIDRMKRGELNKVVLSRVAEARFDNRVDVNRALDYLTEAYPDTYRFLFEPRPYHAFYGATPELLAAIEGRQMRTMALAGSIRRGKTSAEDVELGEKLMHSEKDRYEHQIVVDKIAEKLAPITDQLTIEPTTVMQLKNIQHLYTPITGEMSQSSGVLPVVAALHPTPALGGDPSDLAMDVIREIELVPRGWFAAPVGWIDRHLNGQFVVAIRSAVAQDRRVWMYAGAGIVKDSDPQQEWDETALKFRPMMNALNIEDTD